ncbi:MAG TPA: vanadium-dependent haloperoxidase [Ideonella sp.]|nr:vanadium-dependent haloperoxidase [Ideonella sp.]
MKLNRLASLLATAAAITSPLARADAITDWNQTSGAIIAEAKIGTPPAMRIMALVQTAARDAVEAAQQRNASAEAAIAAAHRVSLTRLLPAQQASIDAAHQAALASIADGAAKSAGAAVGEAAANAVLAARADDVIAPEAYRPHATAGAYVPTAAVAVPQWSQRKPWLLASAAQVRPAAPPSLASDVWARDFNEIKEFGGRNSVRRSAEHTEAARFWDYSLPAIYHGVVRSAALGPNRDLAANARLFATVAQAMDDAMIAVFDAKYHYNFWRPVTAIRNADQDGNDSTQREANWASLIDAPMHPEYPSGHSILAATVATVLKAEAKGDALPVLSTSSPTAKGATRRWASLDEFVREVSDARVHGGIHFRSATDAGEAMGKRIGELAVQRGGLSF